MDGTVSRLRAILGGMARAVLVLGALAAALAAAAACSSRDLAKKPSCKNGGTCPVGWDCGPDLECVFVGSGGFGGGFGGVSGSGAFGGGGSAGFGGSIGGSGGGWLGSACEFDYECTSGLGCMRADSGLLDLASPAKGICTINCQPDPAPCFGMGGGAQCLTFESGESYCMQQCHFGPPGTAGFDSSKCQGRPEMACTPVSGGGSFGVCAPRCNSHTDCNAGWYCHPNDGLCRQEPPLGAPVGEPCAGDDDCLGDCLPIASGVDGGSALSICVESCTHGAPNACGWSDTAAPAPAFCLFGADGIQPVDGPGTGDLGECTKLCDCDDQCPSPFGCVEFFGGDPVSILTQRAGYCANAVNTIGPCG